jgi:hypothetical protein
MRGACWHSGSRSRADVGREEALEQESEEAESDERGREDQANG